MRTETGVARSRLVVACAAVVAAAIAGCAGTADRAPAGPAGFASPTVDIGIVVSDIERSAAFYKNALGLTEVPGFDVPEAMAGDAGLSAYKPFHVRVFVARNAAGATKVKLMQFTDTIAKPQDNAFIHSTLGYRYLTLAVTDMTAAVERARKAGAAPIAKGPVPLPPGFPKGIYLALVRDPDGNLIELVGPKAE